MKTWVIVLLAILFTFFVLPLIVGGLLVGSEIKNSNVDTGGVKPLVKPSFNDGVTNVVERVGSTMRR